MGDPTIQSGDQPIQPQVSGVSSEQVEETGQQTTVSTSVSTDSISQSLTEYYETVTESNNPFLLPPETDDKGNVTDHGSMTESEVSEQLNSNIKEQVLNYPGSNELLQELANQYTVEPHNMTPEEALDTALNELVQTFSNQVTSASGGTLPDHIDELGVDLNTLIGSSLVKLANDKNLPTVANSIRFETLLQSNPSLELLTEVLFEELVNQGVPEDQAKAQAQEQSLTAIDDYFAENEIRGTATTNPAQAKAAIEASLIAKAGSADLDTTLAIVASTMDGMDNLSQMTVWLENIEGIEPTAETSLGGTAALVALDNTLLSAEEMIGELQDMLPELGLSQAEQNAMADYLGIISDAISEIKQILRELQEIMASLDKKTAEQKLGVIEEKHQATLDSFEKKLEEIAKAKAIAKWVKIGAIILTVILTIVAIAATPFTGGASLAIMIAVTVILFATITALQETGTLEPALKAMFTEMSEAFGGGTEGAIIAAIVIIVVMVAISVATRGAASRAIGPMAAIIATMIMSSIATTVVVGIIPHAIQEIGDDQGWDPKTTMIVTIIVTVVAALALGAASGASMSRAAGKMGDSAKTFSQLFQKISQSGFLTKIGSGLDRLQRAAGLIQGVAITAQGGMSVAQGVQQMELADIMEEQGDLETLIAAFEALLAVLEQILENAAGKEGMQDLFEQLDGLQDIFNRLIDQFRQQMEQLAQANQAA